MFNVITKMELFDRPSRPIADQDNFTSIAGAIADLVDGAVTNVTTDTDPVNPVFVLTAVSGNVYEGHDVKGGRVTTLEDYGVRINVDTKIIEGAAPAGTYLVPAVADGTEGKLIAATTGKTAVAQVVVADAINGIYEIKTVSPFIPVTA